MGPQYLKYKSKWLNNIKDRLGGHGGKKMTEKIRLDYFAALHKDRTDTANTLEKPSMRGIWRSVTDKYSDQAHFIYELIQNADDAGAKSARFILEPTRLIFIHNGTNHFSISNPAREEEDTVSGKLGDINAITSAANSNKSSKENKIGKFGVGFKAVFQYTSTPHIYDSDFRFRIDRYIVPTLLDEDFPGRKNEETLFVFPFNHKEKTPQECYTDIAGKLKSLSYPILFLSHLCDISFEIGDMIGLYGKNIIQTIEYTDETTAEKICLMQNCDEDIIDKYLWLFTRYDNGLKYSVGFFLDKDDHLVPANEPAFCYFPTKETTGLNFLIHAPFLLTDSREGIRTGITHNNRLIKLLAEMAGSAILHLRDIGESISTKIIGDDIFSIIPVDEDDFCEIDDTSRISFLPFYTEIKHIFETERIIPTRTGFTTAQNGYWAAVPYLAELFSDTQLAEICSNAHAHWAFVSLGRDEVQRNNKELFSYINEITNTGLSEQHLIRGRYTNVYSKKKDIEGITAQFTEKQSVKWLFSLYKWLSETSQRTELAKNAPIFLDQNSNAATAFKENSDHLILFLPSDDVPDCRTVRKDLLKNKDALELIKKVGITCPSIRDEIFNVIIPQYKDSGEIDTDTHFRLFFKYYRQCPQEEIDDFIDEIRDCEFVSYTTQDDPQVYRGKASTLYMPSDELYAYFETKPTTRFVAYEEYLNLVGVSHEKQLRSFLAELGVKQSVSICSHTLDWSEAYRRNDLPEPHSTIARQYKENYIDGSKELVEFILEHQSIEKSVLLWNQLLKTLSTSGYGGLPNLLYGTCTYFYYSYKSINYDSANATLLKTAAWVMNTVGEFVSPGQLSLKTLAKEYNLDDDNIDRLLGFLGIEDKVAAKEDDNSNLTDSQREKVELADYVMQQGFTKEDLEELAEIKRAREAQQQSSHGFYESLSEDNDFNNWHEAETELDTPNEPTKGEDRKNHLNQTTSRVAKDILNRTKPVPTAHDDVIIDDFEDIDADEFTPSPVDFSRKAEIEKEKAAKAIDRIACQEELQQRALNANRYSYGWFKVLLELEVLNSNSNNLNSKEVSISFAHVEREAGTQRTLILKQPNRYIPQFMEDLADIPLVLRFDDQTKTLAIEVANVKSYTLRVKLKSHVNIKDIDFSKVTEARIDAKSPVFLLEELRKEFSKLGYDDDFNMQENLCENIEFVFGPPGTGKTTHLAQNILIPLMQGNESPKVLVLTPTNKSADVLVRRIMDIMNDNDSYKDWLVRFGGTGDEVIERSPVYRDKTFDIRTLEKNVTVSTIARFPYDFFMPQGTRIFLNGIKWDYIVIDEASMISLVNIVYPLYKKTPKKFIIAGDPFQIEPITSVDLWKNENIYTMVHLDSFVEPHTIPHDYKVTLLTTQYRSVPSVGTVFSKFAYGGILEHYRSEQDQKRLNLGAEFNICPLNIIKFPVSKYESIYRSKRLQHCSSYHIYSAIFTFEYATYLSKAIAKANPMGFFRIGIIAPYRAQADLIEKLIASENLPYEVDIQVGTIHGFQGDECDIIFAVFNTPPNITAGKDMFLNKRNIINVSISRAKDYLFILMPDDNTENINNLRLVKRVEQLIKSSEAFSEMLTPDLEYHMFGNRTYLEDNSFSTGHQSVNVYGLPEKNFEIRSEDAAVDVQIHRSINASSNIENQSTAPENFSNQSEDAPVDEVNVNTVFSSKYGEGEIVERKNINGKTYITVNFNGNKVKYDEAIAFKTKALVSNKTI